MPGVLKLRLPLRLSGLTGKLGESAARLATLGNLRVPHPAAFAPVATLAPPGVPGLLPSARSRWEAILGPNTLLGRAVRAPLWVAMMGIPAGGAGPSAPHRTKGLPSSGVGSVLARLSMDDIAALVGSTTSGFILAVIAELGRRGGDDAVPVLRQLLMRTGHLGVVKALLGISGEAAIAAVVAYGTDPLNVADTLKAEALIRALGKTPGDASTAVLLALSQHNMLLPLKAAIGKILAARGVAVTDIETLLLLAPTQLATEAAVPALLEISLQTTSIALRQAAVMVLRSIPGHAATVALVRVLGGADDQVAYLACQGLLERLPEDAIPELLGVFRDKPTRANSVVLILSGIPVKAATAALVTCLEAIRLRSMQLDIIHELERRHAVAAAPVLERLASEMQPGALTGGPMIAGGAALDAAKALASLPGEASTLALVRVLQASKDNDVLKIAAEALGRRQSVAAIPRLAEIARTDARGYLVYSRHALITEVVAALSKIPGEAATAAMLRLLEDRTPAMVIQEEVLLALDARGAFSAAHIPLLVDCATRREGMYETATLLGVHAIQVLAKISDDAINGILQNICGPTSPWLAKDAVSQALRARGVQVEAAPSAPQAQDPPSVGELLMQHGLYSGGSPAPDDVQEMAPMPAPAPPIFPVAPSPEPPPVARKQVDAAFAAIQVPTGEIHDFVRLLAGTSAGAVPILWALARDAEYRDKVVAALTLLRTWHREQHDPGVPDIGRALLRVQDAGRTNSSLELD